MAKIKIKPTWDNLLVRNIESESSQYDVVVKTNQPTEGIEVSSGEDKYKQRLFQAVVYAVPVASPRNPKDMISETMKYKEGDIVFHTDTQPLELTIAGVDYQLIGIYSIKAKGVAV